MASKSNAFPASVKREASRYWTRERLEGVLDHVIAQGGGGVNWIAHLRRSGHAYRNESGSGRDCQICGEDVSGEGTELLRALAVVQDEAEPDSKWAGLTVKLGDLPFGPTLGFSPTRAAKWVAEEREARKRASPRTRRPDPSSPVSLGLLDAFWPEERIKIASGRADRLMRDGDATAASELLDGTVPAIEKWQMMRVVEDRPTGRILEDYGGKVWLATPAEDVTIDSEPSNEGL